MSEIFFPSPQIRALPDFPVRRTPPRPEARSLHLNEAPLPPPKAAIAAMQDAVTRANRYPDHDGAALVALIAARTGISEDCIVIGSGSNELLYASAKVALQAGDEAVAPHPGFPAYAKSVALEGARLIRVPNRDDGVLSVRRMLRSVTRACRLAFVTSPHNPTGGLLPQSDIEELVAELPEHVFLHFDEAYFEFGRHAGAPDVLPILRRRKGPWIVTRSFSKAYGLAGLRVGYGLTSSPEVAGAYRKVRANFSVNAIALAGACAALQDEAYVRALLEHTARERARLADALRPLGLTALPSAANFVAFVTPGPSAPLGAALAQRDLYVFPFELDDGRSALRISIGTAEDTDAVASALAEALAVRD